MCRDARALSAGRVAENSRAPHFFGFARELVRFAVLPPLSVWSPLITGAERPARSARSARSARAPRESQRSAPHPDKKQPAQRHAPQRAGAAMPPTAARSAAAPARGAERGKRGAPGGPRAARSAGARRKRRSQGRGAPREARQAREARAALDGVRSAPCYSAGGRAHPARSGRRSNRTAPQWGAGRLRRGADAAAGARVARRRKPGGGA